jgi:hypothetical protein
VSRNITCFIRRERRCSAARDLRAIGRLPIGRNDDFALASGFCADAVRERSAARENFALPRRVTRSGGLLLQTLAGRSAAQNAAKHWKSLAPEAGLEPTTNRLTEVGLPQEFADLGASPANVRPFIDDATIDIAQRLVAEAASGTLSTSSVLQLAGAILGGAAGPATPDPTPSSQPTALGLVKPDGWSE